MAGGRLVGKSAASERGEQEVARPVAGEDASRAVASVRRRGEAEDDRPRTRVAESRQWPSPVVLCGEGRARFARDLLPPRDEARAAPAAAHLRGEPREPCFRAASHVGSSSIGSEMSVWLLLVLLGIVKVPLPAPMLWLPFRHHAAATAARRA